MNVSFLLLASGRGTRLSAGVPKAFVPVLARPLVLRSLDRLLAATPDADVVLAVHPADRATHVEPLRDELEARGVRKIVDGGATRQESMRLAFAAADPAAEVIAVHDAARPFPPVDAVRTVIERARAIGAALLAVRAPDTLKRVGGDGLVRETVGRAEIWLAQTPQAIRRDRLEAAIAFADRTGFVGTDDVALCEHAGQSVEVVAGDRRNLKITSPDDLVIATALAALEDA